MSSGHWLLGKHDMAGRREVSSIGRLLLDVFWPTGMREVSSLARTTDDDMAS